MVATGLKVCTVLAIIGRKGVRLAYDQENISFSPEGIICLRAKHLRPCSNARSLMS
jgi:hypothetical protein